MRIAFIILAAVIALFGFKLLLTGIKSFILFFKVDQIPVRAKQTVARDFILGILFIVLAVAMLT